MAPDDSSPPTLVPGMFAGRYELLQELGRGGMGIVYKARDREIDRLVAIKVLQESGLLDAESRIRFLREVRAMAKLNDPGIVAIHDAGETGGRPYLVMELVEGQSLDGVLKKREMELAALIVLLERAARGLAAAHKQEIVHRDLKPGNIFVTAGGHPKIGDFGLAYKLDAISANTQGGAILGTPSYMAPEQADARVGQVSPRTDVYALGAVLYEILTGKTVFPPATLPEMIRAILDEPPVPPSRRGPAVPPVLELICLKALCKKPADRYATAGEFADELRRYLDGETVLARPVVHQERWDRNRRTRRLLGVAGLFGAFAVTVVIAGTMVVRRPPVVPAEGPGARLDEPRKRALALLEEARPALDKADAYLYSPDAGYDELVKRLESAQHRIESAVELAPDLALGHYLLGRTWDLQGWQEKAETCWRRAIKADAGFGPAHYALGHLLMEQWYLRRLCPAVHPESRDGLDEEVSRELEKAAESATEDPVRYWIARIPLVRGPAEGRTILPMVDEALDKCGSTREGTEDLHFMRSMCHFDRERMMDLDRALAVKPRHLLSLFSRGMQLLVDERRREAETMYSNAIAVNPRFFEALYNRGFCRGMLKDLEGALGDFTKAVALRPDLAQPFESRGFTRWQMGDGPGAIEDFSEAIRLRPGSPLAWRSRGAIRCESNSLEDGIADLTEAIRQAPADFKAYVFRATAYCKKGDAGKALADAMAAVDLDRNSPDAHMLRGHIRRSLGDATGALSDFRLSISLAPLDWPQRGEAEKSIEELQKK